MDIEKMPPVSYMPEDYTEAFIQAMDCGRDDFKIKIWLNNISGPRIAEHRGRTYLVYSLDDLYDYAEECLTDETVAMLLDPRAVSDIMEFAHTTDEFFTKLLKSENDIDKSDLALLLGIHNTTGEDFWYVLYNHADDPALYGKAVLAAAETYDLECLKSELVEIFQTRGKEILCRYVDGFFADIALNEDTPEQKSFLVHDVDYTFD